MAAPFVIMQGRACLRRPRIFRDRLNPLEYMDDNELVIRYRLSRVAILEICELVNLSLARATKRSCSLPVSLQVLCALRFCATGSFQTVNGDLHHISQSSVSRCVCSVVDAISRFGQRSIQFTQPEELVTSMGKFSELAHFPNVVGAVDGTHIAIKAPSVDEPLYVNRKGYHSVNVQVICDKDMKILDVVARWPGSTHDSFMWSNSAICSKFEEGQIPQGWLLGDSGYPLRPWLLTPVLHPATEKELRYNMAHARTRGVIERCFGVLKARFRCLDKSGGTVCFTPGKTCRLVVACAFLHNVCLKHNVPLPREAVPVRGNDVINDNDVYRGRLHDGMRVRRLLIENRF